ncbi:MAG: hypothetical protein J3Q66DRAFT_363186 [Benniella sp.]|nr:MAG: hypothetical protein J3Q66DRAFT_363186 [Benniella sp.]
MEHTDKDHTEITRSTTQTSSKTIAMALPEILYNVFTFLDKPSLVACLQVSRVWYSQGRLLAWRTISLDLERFVRLACYRGRINTESDTESNTESDTESDTKSYSSDEDYDKDIQDDRLQDFIENCHHIRSLTLIHPKTDMLFTSSTLDSRAADLKNLVRLVIQLQQPSWWHSSTFYRLTGALVAQNPGIQELELQTDEGYDDYNLANYALKRLSKCLKKLSIVGNFSGAKLTFLKHVINSNERQQEQPQEEQQRPRTRQTTMSRGLLEDGSLEVETGRQDGNNNDQDIGDHRCELQELVLRDIHGYHGVNDSRPRLDLEWFTSVPGELPIRALTMVNFDTSLGDNWDEDSDYYNPVELNGSLLPILTKCPHLERLCISFDRHPDLPENSPCGFLQNIMEDRHFSDVSFSAPYENVEKAGFVEEMYEHCPQLREIELGMFYQLRERHWVEMMVKYGPQLESLSIWGNVLAFGWDAFMSLIGYPDSCPTSGRHHILTRLNINGMDHLDWCAWMAFYQLPSLKEFRARDVPFSAQKLINEDGWICNGLEVLEILVWVPRQMRQSDTLASNEGASSREEKGDIKYEGQYQDQKEDEDDQRSVKSGSKRQRKKFYKMAPRKKEKKFSDDHKRTQIKVCEQLGRLTRLRELRIEGKGDAESLVGDWGCLELTLETGLDRLAPLQQSLEKLIVSGLDEGLGGRKEVEWIARNWVHYNNSRWLEQQHLPPMASDAQPTSSSQSARGPEESRMGSTRPDDGDSLIPIPRFKALIGISENAENAASNIMWLKEQCPTLSVEPISP